MILGVHRERSGSELVFSLLRALMLGYRLWGVESGLQLTELAALMRTTDTRLVGLVVYLATEGLVVLDDAAGTVRLTEQGARNLFGQAGWHPRCAS
jgi:hypothetical protein